MKIVGIVSSSKKNGNTGALVEAVLDSAAKQNAQVKLYRLSDLNYKGCQSCYTCKTQENCVLEDDATPLLKEIAGADAVVLGTPIYMGQMSGQLKLFIDRFYAYVNPDFSSKLPPGKKVLLAVAQGQPDETFYLPYLTSTGETLKFVGFSAYYILPCSGDIPQNKEVLGKAAKVAKWLTE